MAEKNTGGPAFSRAGCEWSEDQGDGAWAQDGMSLRDYFAAKAMQSLILISLGDSKLAKEFFEQARKHGQMQVDYVADCAGEYADAMLRERAK